jgi:hypothetical protein
MTPFMGYYTLLYQIILNFIIYNGYFLQVGMVFAIYFIYIHAMRRYNNDKRKNQKKESPCRKLQFR